MFNYIDSIIQLWDKYQETGEEIYAQEAVIQVGTFISLMCAFFKMRPHLEKFKASLKDTIAKLKKVPEYNKGVGACFIAGTLVLSAAGFVPIETVAAGSLVQSFDPQTQQVSLKEVEETFVRETMEFVHVTVGSEKITTTPEHPFYVVQKGFVKATKLRAGDILCTVNGEYVIVEQVQHEILESPVKVFNFRVADNHTYYVGNVSVGVHNAECVETGGSGETNAGGSYSPKNKTSLWGQEKYVTEKDLNTIKQHLSGKYASEFNDAMINRLENAYKNNTKISGADLDFYAHELYESNLMKNGMSYTDAHNAAKEYYNAVEFNFYHPEVIKQNPRQFSDVWFDFWGIERD